MKAVNRIMQRELVEQMEALVLAMVGMERVKVLPREPGELLRERSTPEEVEEVEDILIQAEPVGREEADVGEIDFRPELLVEPIQVEALEEMDTSVKMSV